MNSLVETVDLSQKVESTLDFANFENRILKLEPALQVISQKFITKLTDDSRLSFPKLKRKSLLILVNEKKVFLQQIFVNLYEHIKNYTALDVTVEYIDNLKPGCFTNHCSRHYRHPDSILMIYTKNHCEKEKRILTELSATNIDLNVLCLITQWTPKKDDLNIYHNAHTNIVQLADVKSLYWFLFGVNSVFRTIHYDTFCKENTFKEIKYDFKTHDLKTIL